MDAVWTFILLQLFHSTLSQSTLSPFTLFLSTYVFKTLTLTGVSQSFFSLPLCFQYKTPSARSTQTNSIHSNTHLRFRISCTSFLANIVLAVKFRFSGYRDVLEVEGGVRGESVRLVRKLWIVCLVLRRTELCCNSLNANPPARQVFTSIGRVLTAALIGACHSRDDRQFIFNSTASI